MNTFFRHLVSVMVVAILALVVLRASSEAFEIEDKMNQRKQNLHEISQWAQKLKKAAPQYFLKTVKPKPNIDYKMTNVTPDPHIDFKLIVVNPDASSKIPKIPFWPKK